MIKIFCDNCDKDITGQNNTYPFFLNKHKTHFCDTLCRVEHDKRTGHFKAMSDKGKAGRSRVMPISNKEKPRRRKKVV